MTTQTDSLGRLIGWESRQAERLRTARFVVMVGRMPYCSTLGIYDDYRSDKHRQWNPVGDGFDIDLGLSGIATLAEAIRECDAAFEPGMADRPYVVELPVRVNPNVPQQPNTLPGSLFDPELSRVYIAQ